MNIDDLEIGDVVYLKKPVKDYRRVEIAAFYGRDILVRTESGWEFTVRADELENE